MHIKSIRHQRVHVSKATRERVARRYALRTKLNVPKRRDFTTPRQRVRLTLKAAVEGFVWPTLV